MGFTVSSASRRLVMAVLLGLAMAGAVIRFFAPNPSTLRDVGTLLLVLWLPAVGNLVAYFVRKIPHSVPPPTDFEPGAPFTAHLGARLEAVPLPSGFAETLAAADGRCVLVSGRRGLTARTSEPLARALAAPGQQPIALELLRPAAGLPHLAPGTEFHLLLGTQAVAKGTVLTHTAP